MSYERHGKPGAPDAEIDGDAWTGRPAPGKRALTSSIPMLGRATARDTDGPSVGGKPAPGSQVGAGHGSLLGAVEGGGHPLPHRQQMERAFGEDFSGLSVSLGTGSTLDAIDASAATDGTSIAFASANPSPEEVAHELAHVVQRRRHGGGGGQEQSDKEDPAEAEAELVAARVARGQDAGAVKERADALIHRRERGATLHPQAGAEVIRRYDAFVDGIYAAARRIVMANIQAVEAWRNYVLNQLTPGQMGGQVYGTAFQQLEGQAAANNAQFLLPYYAAEPNPIRQQLYEHQMAGQWRACTGCHVSNQAWALDGRMRDQRNPGITPAELLSGHAGIPFSSGRALDAGIFRDGGSWNAAFAPPQAPPQPANQPPPGGSTLPAHAPPAPLDPQRNGEESLAAARRALLAIQPHLQPLGDAGYKIIPSNVISRFGNAPIGELRTALEAAFARRLSGYQQLMGRIGSQSIEYLEFDNLVSMLKPMAQPDVQALIDDDKRRKERQEVIEFVGLLLLDLLSIVVPPIAIIAGAAHMAHGANQMIVGNDRNNATGLHGMMSPERQASGAMMMTAGALEVMGGAMQVAIATSGMRAAGGAGRVISTQRQGEITLELMDSGVVRATHAGYPGKSIVMQPNGSFQAFDELGNVVGNGVVGRGGGQAAAAQAWGTPGQAPMGTSIVPARPANANLVPASPAGLAPRSQWPAVSPFYTGGSSPGTLQPTPYNPCGRADNCGFSSMSYAQSLQNPNGPLRTADDLYLERLGQLGFTVDDNLSRQLVFPERTYDGLRPRPGYGPLFDDAGGNQLSDWTLPTTARSLGIPGTEANDALVRWQIAYGRHPTLDAAVQARIDFLETHGNQCPNPAAVRTWIETARANLPGTYIVGSRSSAHYMTVTIDANGQISGFDPQNGANFPSLEAVQARMGQGGFDMMYKVTLPLPPTGGPP